MLECASNFRNRQRLRLAGEITPRWGVKHKHLIISKSEGVSYFFALAYSFLYKPVVTRHPAF